MVPRNIISVPGRRGPQLPQTPDTQPPDTQPIFEGAIRPLRCLAPGTANSVQGRRGPTSPQTPDKVPPLTHAIGPAVNKLVSCLNQLVTSRSAFCLGLPAGTRIPKVPDRKDGSYNRLAIRLEPKGLGRIPTLKPSKGSFAPFLS